MTKTDLQSWLEAARKQLVGDNQNSSFELYSITSYILERPKEWILTHGDIILPNEIHRELDSCLDRLLKGEPLPYITGRQSFYGLDFFVNQDVLIPRPETELLVENAIEWLTLHPDRREQIDVGTGTGIIPITLADRFPDLHSTAIDVSDTALKVAAANISKFSLEPSITLLHNDLLNGLTITSDLITANLPYIPQERLPSLRVSNFEPKVALDGGEQGFELLRKLLSQLPSHLLPGGLALLEIDYYQKDLSIEVATNFFPSAKITVLNDLADLPRLLRIQA
jgi:release factor glutamine methyltransferase